jgi:hypothetical protein
MKVRITEENNSLAEISFELDDNGRMSLEYLQSCFPGATGVKFRDLASGKWKWLVVCSFFLSGIRFIALFLHFELGE